jgi:hypothetical protein
MPVAKTTIGIVSITAVGDDYLDFNLYVGVSPYFINLGAYSYSAGTFTPTVANGNYFGPLTVIITGVDASYDGLLEYEIEFDDGSEVTLQLEVYVDPIIDPFSVRTYVDTQGNCFMDPELTILNNLSVVEEEISAEEDVSDPASFETIVEDDIDLLEGVNEEFSGAEIDDKVSLREVVFEEGYEDINFVIRIVDTVDILDVVSVEDSVSIEESVFEDMDVLTRIREIVAISEIVNSDYALIIDENVPIEDGLFFSTSSTYLLQTTPFTLGGNALKHLVSVSLIGDDLEGVTCTLLYRYSKSAEWSESDAKEMMVNGNVYFGISGREFKLVFSKSTAYTLTSVLVRFKSDDKQFKRGYYGGQIDSQAGR